MKQATKRRKALTRQIFARRQAGQFENYAFGLLASVIKDGKAGFDKWQRQLGIEMATVIMEIERQERAGRDYDPKSENIRKGGSQRGSIYVEDSKFSVTYPRMQKWSNRDNRWKEAPLKSYRKLHEKGQFSEGLLTQMLGGLAARRYEETVASAAGAFGVSPSAVSRHLVTATAAKLAEFRERSLAEHTPFAVFLDTVHRGGAAFIVALGVDIKGAKQALGFWEGETENREICEALLRDVERRGLKLSIKTIFVVDGGKGIQAALKARYGKKLLLQRCAIHKERNITRQLPEKYRGEVRRRFQMLFGLNSYAEAQGELAKLEKWLRAINESAADSLLEAGDDLLTVHRLKVPALLRKSLYSTNPIESMFSMVRTKERNIKRIRGSAMSQRWLGTVLLDSEKHFRRVKGHAAIAEVIATIEQGAFAKGLKSI